VSPSSGTIEAGWRAAPPLERIGALLATRAAWWSVCAATCVILLAPLFVVDVPPLLDYPNHLARMFVLAFGQHDAVLSRIYAQHWTIIPNLAIDLVLPEMLRVLPIHVVGRIALGVTLLLPFIGVVTYSRIAFGVRSYWPLAGSLIAYNALFILGFVNFQISLGMALLIAAGRIYGRERWRVLTVVVTGLCTIGVFFMHICGLVFLAVLIGANEGAELHRRLSSGDRVRQHVLRRGLMGVMIFLPPAVLYFVAPFSRTTTETRWAPLMSKMGGLLVPFIDYAGTIGRMEGALFLGFVYLCFRYRTHRLACGSTVAFAALMLMYLAAPFTAKGGAFIDSRFVLMAAFLLFAGFMPARLPRYVATTAAAVMIAVFVVRMAGITATWQQHNDDVREMRQAIAPVSPGSRVLVASVTQNDNPGYWRTVPSGRLIPAFKRTDFHLAALLLIERRAFWPLLFTRQGQQPLVVQPPYDRIAIPIGEPPSFHQLEESTKSGTFAPYLEDWRHDFDYVLLLNAGGAGDLTQFLPDKLQLVVQTDVAALFHIRRN
jgi:hypothetical protein